MLCFWVKWTLREWSNECYKCDKFISIFEFEINRRVISE